LILALFLRKRKSNKEKLGLSGQRAELQNNKNKGLG
jgi:hypothetical protein